MSNTPVAVFGLGSMGLGMAQSLMRAGLPTHGFDIDPQRVRRFRDQGGCSGELEQVIATVSAAIVVVLNAAQVESVLFGETGIAVRMPKGSVVICCATVPPQFSREMAARCLEHGVQYLDAPISGGAVKAADGRLSVMASGSRAAFDAAARVLEATAEQVFDLGDTAGAGSAMKAVNQLLAGVHIATMAEAVTFGVTQGIDPAQFLHVIRNCAGTSWMLENRAPHIVEGDYTPRSSVNIWPKDLGIVLEIARDAGFAAPMTQAALQQFQSAAEAGLGGEDDAAVAKIYARQADVTLPGEDQ